MPQLRQNKGSIIMTSSGVSLRPNKAWNAYAAAKRAMNSVCAGLDLEEPDISTVCITPGIVDTGIQKQVRENRKSHTFRTSHKTVQSSRDNG
jgi:NAD(P)-dependent dehydrogenase (short-subunit alcohol dehydrogenase family)